MSALTLADLADLPIWVAWQGERTDSGKITKVPKVSTHRNASSTDPSTWATRTAAVDRAEALSKPEGIGGKGIVLGREVEEELVLVGFDLDTCRAANGGGNHLAEWAQTVVEGIDTYTEISPSETGVKCFFMMQPADVDALATRWGLNGGKWKRGDDPDAHLPAIELHLGAAYFTVTDNLFGASPTELRVVDLATVVRVIDAAVPKLLGEEGDEGGAPRPRDDTPSGIAWHLGLDARRDGRSFDEFRAAILADPVAEAWYRGKRGRGEYHLEKIWKKIGIDPVTELNASCAVIRVVNRVAILNEHLDAEGQPSFSLLSPDSFKLLLANHKIEIKVKNRKGEEETQLAPLANLWLGHPRRRQHEGITFAPHGAPAGYYNLWQGFAIEPSKSGSCALFKAHLRDNVCQRNSDHFDWVFGWFADIIQHPAVKCGTSLVLRGSMGVGKTIVGETFGRLLGLHYVQVADPRYVTGRFNAHLVRCLLFHCDEAFWAGDHAAEGKLKDLVTGKRHPIELKGFEVFFVPNYVRLFINGNPGWLVPAGMDERRFATLDVGDAHKQDIPYFREIVDELENGGYARLLHELLNFDLSLVDLRTIPKTDALLDQKIQSLAPERAWWLDVLKNGRLPWCNKNDPSICPGKALYDHYIRHAQATGARRRQIETAIGIFLRDAVIDPNTGKTTLKSYVGTYDRPDSILGGSKTERGTIYQFPALKVCREAFERTIQQSIDWDEPKEWQSWAEDADTPF